MLLSDPLYIRAKMRRKENTITIRFQIHIDNVYFTLMTKAINLIFRSFHRVDQTEKLLQPQIFPTFHYEWIKSLS